MDARKLIQDIPTNTLIEMVRLLTRDSADPQFVRAIAANLKDEMNKPASTGASNAKAQQI